MKSVFYISTYGRRPFGTCGYGSSQSSKDTHQVAAMASTVVLMPTVTHMIGMNELRTTKMGSNYAETVDKDQD